MAWKKDEEKLGLTGQTAVEGPNEVDYSDRPMAQPKQRSNALPAYSSKYDAGIDLLLDDILGSSYDQWTQGSDYARLRGNYEQNGQRAMQNTLAQVSARTGGLASSYAGQAAQGAYNEHMRALEEAAMAMYDDEMARKYDQLNLLRGVANDDYGRYRDSVSDAMWQQNFDYGKERDAVADQRYADEWQYQLDRDKVADDRYNSEREYQQGRDALADQRYDAEWQYQLGRDAIADQRYEDSQGNGDPGYSISDITKMVEKGIIDVTTAQQLLGLGEVPAGEPKGPTGNPTLYNQILDSFKGMQAGYSKDMLREALLSVAGNPGDPGALSDEEVEQLMDIFGL